MTVVVRDEEPPGDTVVVVRGGVTAAESVQQTATVSMTLQGFYGVSVFLAVGMTVEELVLRTPELSPERYKQLRTSTVGVLRSSGFSLLATAEWPHFDVVLPDLQADTIDAFRSCFGPPFPNPGLRGRLEGQ